MPSLRPTAGFYAKTFGALFAASFVIGLALFTIILSGGDAPERQTSVSADRQNAVVLKPLAPGVVVTSQLRPGDFAGLRRRGARAVIDLRPEGEAPDQPTVREMAGAAQAASLSFFYTPTPHGAVPPEVVRDFTAALALIRANPGVGAAEGAEAPIVLFCRSGARAVRVWALAEATRPGGMSLEQIERAATGAGFSIDDERQEIVRRIAARGA